MKYSAQLQQQNIILVKKMIAGSVIRRCRGDEDGFTGTSCERNPVLCVDMML